MRQLFAPIMALMFSVALLLTGHGLLLVLLPLRGAAHGFSPTQIGLTASSYYLGFVAGCLLVPHIVRRSGHIRTFAVLGALFSAAILVFNMLPVFTAWVVLRFLVGACMAGAYMVIESWLNERATPESRGTILATYSMVSFLMIATGQQLFNVAPRNPDILFSLAAILVAIAIIPVSLTLSLAPTPIQNVRINLRQVWRISHVGLLGATVAGMVTGSFWALAPVFARGIGMDAMSLTLFISAAVLGGAAFQLPLGRLSDYCDRRLVLFYIAFAGVLISMAIFLAATLWDQNNWTLIGLSFVWGGCTMTLYAISLAHANDCANPENFVMVGSAMLLCLGLSSAAGAPLASLLTTAMGQPGLFVFIAVCLVAFMALIFLRRRAHVLPARDPAEAPFRVVAETSPVALALDPRTETEEPASRPDIVVQDMGAQDMDSQDMGTQDLITRDTDQDTNAAQP